MPGAPPDGVPVPPDGRLEPAALDRLGTVPFGIYVHVPFCATRCGYCDFNTYTAAELGGGASRDSYASLAVAEIALARTVLGPSAPPVSTAFFGGGTPGERAQDWELSVRSAIGAGPDHISAYALIVEDGTRLAARIRRGELPPPDDDEMADRYLAADELFSAAGLRWYEISNWAASPDAM